MGIPVAELRLSQEYLVDGERLTIVGFGRRPFLESSCGVVVPADIDRDEVCVVCQREGDSEESIVRPAAAFAATATPCLLKSVRP